MQSLKLNFYAKKFIIKLNFCLGAKTFIVTASSESLVVKQDLLVSKLLYVRLQLSHRNLRHQDCGKGRQCHMLGFYTCPVCGNSAMETGKAKPKLRAHTTTWIGRCKRGLPLRKLVLKEAT